MVFPASFSAPKSSSLAAINTLPGVSPGSAQAPFTLASLNASSPTGQSGPQNLNELTGSLLQLFSLFLQVLLASLSGRQGQGSPNDPSGAPVNAAQSSGGSGSNPDVMPQAQAASAPSQLGGRGQGNGQLSKPLSNYSISQGFTGQHQHEGIDLAAPRGTEIHAASGGTIKTVGFDQGGFGNYVVIDHGNGLETLYGHLDSRSPLREGQSVSQGQVIGPVGSTGDSTGNHLHFEVHQNGQPQDPEKFIHF